MASCSASGDVAVTAGNSDSCTGGLVGAIIPGSPGCILFSCLATGDVNCRSNGGAFLGGCWGGSGNVSIFSCLATGALTGVDSNFSGYNQYVTFDDCAYTDTQTDSKTGIADNIVVNNLYTTVINNNNFLDGVKTLHWSAADGYTPKVAIATWYAEHLWKDNGTAAPTIDMAYEGTPLYNASLPKLVAIPGKAAYYVAPVNAKNAGGQEDMTWDEAMADGICLDGWHVPTKDDFIAMGADKDYITSSYNTAFVNAFPSTRYWLSSTIDASDAWCIHVMDDSFIFLDVEKTTSYVVRCVRKK